MPAPTCRACCPTCNLHFTGQVAFDRHLGNERKGWAHNHPLDVTDDDEATIYGREGGRCRNGPEADAAVMIWHIAASRAEARAHFGWNMPVDVPPNGPGAISSASGYRNTPGAPEDVLRA